MEEEVNLIMLRIIKKINYYMRSENATNRRRFNYLFALVQKKILKNSKLFTYPINLTICPGNVCNLQCVLCPTGKNQKGRKRGFMTFETFKKIIDECGPYIYSIDLFNWGEPLLNKDIFKMIKYAKKFKVKVTISSNLNYFNKDICNNLVESGLDQLIVSLDGASQKSVSKYQKGNNFRSVINNMKRIMEKKEELKYKLPLVQWRFLVNKYNENEIKNAKKLAKELKIDRLEIGLFRCDMGDELLLDNKSQIHNVGSWLPKKESLSMYDYSKKMKKKIKINECGLLWTQSTINWNGSVSPCCAVWHEKFDFGNINDHSFFEMWNNKKYKEARKIIKGRISKAPKNICYICKINKAII